MASSVIRTALDFSCQCGSPSNTNTNTNKDTNTNTNTKYKDSYALLIFLGVALDNLLLLLSLWRLTASSVIIPALDFSVNVVHLQIQIQNTKDSHALLIF